jgi:hypothetical protein
MKAIHPKPYRETKNKDFFEPVVIELRNLDFIGVSAQMGKIAIVFQFCFFNKLKIENIEEIDFPEVSISFMNCLIQELHIETITSKNISISFHASMLAGKVSAAELLSVSVNNCLLESSLFLLDVPKIDISYTTENIFPYWWKRLFDKRRIRDTNLLFIREQRYHIENPKRLKIHSSKKASDSIGFYIKEFNTEKEYRIGYRLLEEEENLLKVQLFLKYGPESPDEQTLIDNVGLYSLSLNGSPNGKLSIENTQIGNWYLSEFLPKGETGFYNINPRQPHDEDTKIGIHKCDLDNVRFENVYFGEFSRLSFYRSKFSNAVFMSCSFPEDYKKFAKFTPGENVHYPENKTENFDKDQYEIFLQLKKALDATGNYYEGNKLLAMSHTALAKVESIATGERFILKTNWLSNNHGLSILRPFLWLFSVSIIFYLAYLWSASMLFQPTDFDPNLIGYYFSFLDFTHRNDFLLDKKEINGWLLAIDYLNKVFLGYFIFQFISAFRKYGKK